ncbi:hypothetical protein ETB97_001129 [Aspergillus alliaceus]|uniref:CCHC-type domain-containing protein n=1 Tax=Petromyces alliaceus TaxID=209559 RepID=A0A8H6ACH9_PETAA|nr:hypothetical protein ETB97_001129 [Aspergillus burnettii]
MVREAREYRRCHVCWERGHIAVDCPVRQALLHLANMASELNDRIRRTVPVRVYRVEPSRRRYRPPRRRHGRDVPERNLDRRHVGRHNVRPRQAPVNREPDREDRRHYRRDSHDPHCATPPVEERDNMRLTLTGQAQLQTSVAHDRDNHGVRFDTSITAPSSFTGTVFSPDTKTESDPGDLNEHLADSASDYVQMNQFVDVQTTDSDTLAASTENGNPSEALDNLRSLRFNLSGDMGITGESEAIIDEYCSPMPKSNVLATLGV